MSDSRFTFTPVALIRSPYKEKFGIPRQPQLVQAEGFVELLPPFDRDEAVEGLEGFSHLWLVFVFHGVKPGQWSPTVRPPRLGGNRRVGVFASRSTHRPNPIGLSVVELAGIEREGGKLRLRVRGLDLLDGTPVLDIKPYVPYADALPAARAGFAPAPPPAALTVHFSAGAEAECEALAQRLPQLRRVVEQVIALDPRPAYHDEDGRIYGVRLYDRNVRFTVRGTHAEVIGIEAAEESTRAQDG